MSEERIGIVSEFILFIKENKAYWMIPIVVVSLLLAGILAAAAFGGGAAAPFIYTLF